MIEKTVEFLGFKSKVIRESYWGNGRICLQLVSAEDNQELDISEGEPVTTATINIPEVPLESNEVIIKNYSENEGILDSLVKAKIVKPTGKTVKTGFVECSICELLEGSI